jgi:hypothetical protein
MYKIHLVTYATHSEGLFDNLINNKFNKKIDIVGWNTKFVNYIDKIYNLLNYINYLNDNDIIIYLDGFDSLIHKNFNNEELYTLFKSFDTKILISKDSLNSFFINNHFIKKFLYNFCYGKYDNDNMPNTGMIMGYVENLKILFNCMISQNITDDQLSLSKCFDNNIKVDIDNKLFLNTKYNDYINNKKNINSIFISFPLGFTNTNYDNKRLKRFILIDYVKYLFIFIFIILTILILFNKKSFKIIYKRNRFLS